MAELPARIRAELEALADAEAPELLAEIRAEARARVRAQLVDAMEEALLARLTPSSEERPEGAPVSGTTGASEATPASGRTGTSETPAHGSARIDAPPARAARPGPPRPGADTGRDRRAADGLGWYVYGVIAAPAAEAAADLDGIESGRSVACIGGDGVAALVSQVALSEFGEDQMREHLNDLAWVERVARAHERVLDHVLARTTVIPMRMCTVYRSATAVQEMLEREASALEQALDELAGKHEWGVKGYIRVTATPDTEPREPADRPGAGTAYMAARRADRDRQADAERRGAEAAAEIHESLAAVASDGRMNPLTSPEATGHPGMMVLNGVYLVRHGSLEAFHAEVDRLEEQFASLGLELVETGPWPPYNFLPGQIGAAW